MFRDEINGDTAAMYAPPQETMPCRKVTLDEDVFGRSTLNVREMLAQVMRALCLSPHRACVRVRPRERSRKRIQPASMDHDSSSSSVSLSSLELSDTKVYEPSIRSLLGTASHLCEAVVLELRTGS